MHKIVFDIETSNLFSDVGVNDPAALTISVVGIYDSETDSYSSFLESELKKLWPIIEKADILIGYNSNHFDIPLLDKYYPGDLTKIKSLDLMKEVQNVLGRRIKLDTLAEATLGKNKTGNGLEAIKLWKQGEVEKVRSYCLQDVKITKELYEYMLENGKVKYLDGKDTKELKIDTSKWEEKSHSAMTHTLPF
ncbi:MAG: ribonuclease H-like domain-containing protein [Candidatus Paceibacterota bacterium]|jgi:DEAD/DEAH box helicase domain-containing protein